MKGRILAAIAVVLAVAATAAAMRYRVRVSSLELELAAAELRIRDLQAGLPAAPAVRREVEVLPERQGDAEEIARLKAELAARAEELAVADATPPAQPAQPPSRRESREGSSAGGTSRADRESRVSYMERLKETDPKRYEEIRASRAEAAERANNIIAEQYRFLSSLDVSAFSAEQQAGHQQVLERLAQASEAVAKIDPAKADPHELGHEVFRSLHDALPLLANERQMLLYDTALRAGYKGDAAQEFVDYVEYIDAMTSPRSIMRGIGMGGGMGRGGGWGPPRDGGSSGDARPRP